MDNGRQEQQFAVITNELKHIKLSIERLETYATKINTDHEDRIRILERNQNIQQGRMAVIAALVASVVTFAFSFIGRIIA